MTEAKGEVSASPHVFIAIPSYSGILAKQTVDSLDGAERLIKADGWNMSVSVITGDCYIQHARNTLVHQFMESGADCLFFIDDDVGFPPEAFLRLLNMDDDFVFGAYPMKSDEPGFPVVIHTDKDGFPIVREDGCVDSSGAPTGFMRIKRSVIERLQEANPGRKYGEFDGAGNFLRTAYDLFPQGAKNGRWWGEDIAFCNLWTDIGGTIWCVPDIDFVHVGKGGKVYSGNYHQFLLNCPGGSGNCS